MTRGDFAALNAQDRDLDWPARLILAAIRSLEAMVATEMGDYENRAADPHRGWLNDRNQALARINKASSRSDEQINDLLNAVVAIEKRINDTPARTSDGLVAKMVLAFQTVAEGHEPSEEAAAAIVRESQCLLDIGSLAEASDEIQIWRAA